MQSQPTYPVSPVASVIAISLAVEILHHFGGRYGSVPVRFWVVPRSRGVRRWQPQRLVDQPRGAVTPLFLWLRNAGAGWFQGRNIAVGSLRGWEGRGWVRIESVDGNHQSAGWAVMGTAMWSTVDRLFLGPDLTWLLTSTLDFSNTLLRDEILETSVLKILEGLEIIRHSTIVPCSLPQLTTTYRSDVFSLKVAPGAQLKVNRLLYLCLSFLTPLIWVKHR